MKTSFQPLKKQQQKNSSGSKQTVPPPTSSKKGIHLDLHKSTEQKILTRENCEKKGIICFATS